MLFLLFIFAVQSSLVPPGQRQASLSRIQAVHPRHGFNSPSSSSPSSSSSSTRSQRSRSGSSFDLASVYCGGGYYCPDYTRCCYGSNACCSLSSSCCGEGCCGSNYDCSYNNPTAGPMCCSNTPVTTPRGYSFIANVACENKPHCKARGAQCCPDDRTFCGGEQIYPNGTVFMNPRTECCPEFDACVVPTHQCCSAPRVPRLAAIACEDSHSCCLGNYGVDGFFLGTTCCANNEKCYGGFCCPKNKKGCKVVIKGMPFVVGDYWGGGMTCSTSEVILTFATDKVHGQSFSGIMNLTCGSSGGTSRFRMDGLYKSGTVFSMTFNSWIQQESTPCLDIALLSFQGQMSSQNTAYKGFTTQCQDFSLYAYRPGVCCDHSETCCSYICCPGSKPVCCGNVTHPECCSEPPVPITLIAGVGGGAVVGIIFLFLLFAFWKSKPTKVTVIVTRKRRKVEQASHVAIQQPTYTFEPETNMELITISSPPPDVTTDDMSFTDNEFPPPEPLAEPDNEIPLPPSASSADLAPEPVITEAVKEKKKIKVVKKHAISNMQYIGFIKPEGRRPGFDGQYFVNWGEKGAPGASNKVVTEVEVEVEEDPSVKPKKPIPESSHQQLSEVKEIESIPRPSIIEPIPRPQQVVKPTAAPMVADTFDEGAVWEEVEVEEEIEVRIFTCPCYRKLTFRWPRCRCCRSNR